MSGTTSPRRGIRANFFGDGQRPKTLFSLGFGVVAPALCLLFDPIVFRGSFDKPLLGTEVLPGSVAAGFVGLQSLTLVWLIGGEPSSRWIRSLLAGWLLGGGLFSLALALLMIPLTMIGIIFVIGVLGLIPFLTAHVYFSWSCYLRRGGSREEPVPRVGWIAGCALALVVLLGGRALVHSVSADVLEAAVSGSDADFVRAHERLRRWQALIPRGTFLPALRKACRSVNGTRDRATLEGLPPEVRRLALAASTVSGLPPLTIIENASWWNAD